MRGTVARVWGAIEPIAWTALVGALFALGAWARVRHFAGPAGFLFDEHHFVENARNYLAGRADWNDHPPLGKLIIAASIRLLGDQSLAWRLPSALCGVVALVAGGLAAARLFRSRHAGVLAAALLASDGFTIAYSRAALLDGPLAMCLALALLLATARPRLSTALAGGLLLGVASSLKFSGVGVALPLLTGLVLAEPRWSRRLGLLLVAALTAAVVYFSAYSFGLGLSGQSTGVSAVLADTARLLEHHAALTDMKNPWVSGWSTWWLPLRAWPLAYQPGPDGVRVLSMLGNLATWWSAVAVGLRATGVVLVRGTRAMSATPAQAADAVARHGSAVLVLLSGALGFLAPWVLSHRDSYLYHFLPSYLALVLLLSGTVSELRARHPTRALSWLAVVVTVAALYEPLWCFTPVSADGYEWRLFFRGWR